MPMTCDLAIPIFYPTSKESKYPNPFKANGSTENGTNLDN